MSRKNKKKRFHLFRFLFEVLVLVILAAGLFVASKFTKIGKGRIEAHNLIKNENIAADELDRMDNFTDIALFGVDSREGAMESGTNSDTIMICSINKKTHEIKLTSVYRDTYLDTTDGEYRKCTEVYAIGGTQQAISMLNKNLDLNITDYVTVNFEAVVEIVDLLGGVDINLTEGEAQWINNYLVEGRQVLGRECEDVPGPGMQHLNGMQALAYVDINLTEGEAQWINNYLVEGRQVLGRECEDVPGPGMQHLNGMQALAYSRIRYIGLDYERTERQRTVLTQLFEKAKNISIFDINTILDKALPLVSTSLSTGELISLATGVGRYSMGETQGFPFEKTTANIAAGDCVIPVNLAANVSELHSFLYGTSSYVPSATVQEISDNIAAETGIY